MKNKGPLQIAAVLGALLVLILCFQSRQVYGYAVSKTNGGNEIHWSTPSAGFYINTAGFPSGGLQAIQSAMQTWTNVSTSNFNFIYRGGLTTTAYGENDGINLICFGSFGAGYESTLAVNTFWYTASGQLLDSDIKFNENFEWASNGSKLAYDIQSIGLHELGHALSLEDLYDPTQTSMAMYYRFSPGQIKQSLTPDDKNGISYLYSGGSVTTTTTVSSFTTTTSISSQISSCPAEAVLGPEHPDLENLRAFRDGPLASSAVGRRLTQIYYNNAESIDGALERSPALRAAARKLFEAIAVLERTID